MQEFPQKSVKVAIEITLPEISPKQLQFDSDPDTGADRVMLGQGGFGRVYAGHYQNQTVAIKSLHVSTPKLIKSLQEEAALMFRLASPHTVALHGIYVAPNETALVMERMMGGSLFHLLQDDTYALDWPTRYRLAYETAQGIQMLHQQLVVHRDLKSLNVLLDTQQHAKITDFGFSKLRGQISSMSASSKHSVGTPAYKAPEIVALDMAGGMDDDDGAAAEEKQSPYTPYSDIYAYGVILWELATRKIPFAGKNPLAVLMALSQGKTEKIPADCPPELAALIQACWAIKPGKRPRTDEVVEKTKALYLAAQAPAAPAQPPAADEKQDYIPAPWHMDPATKAAAGPVQNYALLPAGVEDMTKVVASYQRAPVPGYGIKSVQVVYNPSLNREFDINLRLLEKRHGKSAFEADWRNESGPSGAWRRTTHQVLEQMAAPHQDPNHPHVTLLPMWHTTKQEVLSSLFETGFANLAKTDPGFFGKGIYSAGEASYSYRVYGTLNAKNKHPVLLMNWVASYSAYPVIHGDMAHLEAGANFENYDAHFIPVRPQNPNNSNETVFYPCKPNQAYQYTELVVFKSSQCLPRYVVELQSDLLPTPADIQEAALKAQAEQQQKAHAQQQAEQAQKQQAAQQAAEQAQKQAEAAQKEQQKLEEIEKAKTIAVQEAVAKAQLKADQEAKAALAKAKQEADQQAKAQAEAASKQAEKMKQLEAKLAAAEAAALKAQAEKQAAEMAQKSQAEQTQKAQAAAQQAQFQAEGDKKAEQAHKAQTAAQTEQAKKAQEAADRRLAEQLTAQQPQPPAKAAGQEAGWLSKLGLFLAAPKVQPNPQAAPAPDDGKEADIPSAHPQDIAKITELLKQGGCDAVLTDLRKIDKAKLKPWQATAIAASEQITAMLTKNHRLANSVELFLLYVAAGEQDRAAAMLKANPQLALAKGTVTDLSGRTFEEITGFQYAVWALDWHMWKMMFNVETSNQGYLTPAQAASQIEGLAQGKWVKTYGMHFDFTPLTNALDTYVKNYGNWNGRQREAHWCQQVGGAQLWLPAHVINEYCRPDRSFDPTPGFVDATLPRTMKTDEGFWFTAEYNGGKLSVKFGVVRGRAVGRACEMLYVRVGVPGRRWSDHQSMIALEKTRLQQLEGLKSTLTSAHGPGW